MYFIAASTVIYDQVFADRSIHDLIYCRIHFLLFDAAGCRVGRINKLLLTLEGSPFTLDEWEGTAAGDSTPSRSAHPILNARAKPRTFFAMATSLVAVLSPAAVAVTVTVNTKAGQAEDLVAFARCTGRITGTSAAHTTSILTP